MKRRMWSHSEPHARRKTRPRLRVSKGKGRGGRQRQMRRGYKRETQTDRAKQERRNCGRLWVR
eukprot:3817127-Pleurochrysis_carterae.AAC.1